MSDGASSSEGVEIRRGDGATPEVFTKIGKIYDFSGLEETGENIDVTSFDDSFKRYIGGIGDGGVITLQFWWVSEDAQQQGLRSDRRARTLRNFVLDFDDAGDDLVSTTIAFTALVQSWGPVKAGVNNALSCSATLKISGQPTYTLGH